MKIRRKGLLTNSADVSNGCPKSLDPHHFIIKHAQHLPVSRIGESAEVMLCGNVFVRCERNVDQMKRMQLLYYMADG